MRSRLFLAVIISFSILVVNAQDKSYPAVTISGTEVREYTSQNLDHDYKLLISFPQDYDVNAGKEFPVVYLLDAQWDFPFLNGVFGQLYYDGAMPGAILVGVTWGGENPDHDSLRAGSFTPTHNNQISNSGKAAQFLNLLKEEIVPFVDSNYKTDKEDRTLIGSSFGGLFTLYTLFTETELFNRYVLTSPAIAWDNFSIYQYEKAYAESNSSLPVRVYMTVGGYEDVASYQKFVDVLKSRNYEGLELEATVLPITGHSGGKAEGYSRGLRFVFEKPSFELSEDVLLQYVGTYKMASGENIEIVIESGSLAAVMSNGNKIDFLAESESNFYRPGHFIFVHFEKDDSGKVTGFKLKQYGGSMTAEKIN